MLSAKTFTQSAKLSVQGDIEENLNELSGLIFWKGKCCLFVVCSLLIFNLLDLDTEDDSLECFCFFLSEKKVMTYHLNHFLEIV